MDWRKYLNPGFWHPAAKLFRLIPEKELCELAEDIAKNGLLEPVILLADKVLDGRNRLIACDKAGKEPWFEQWKEKKMTPTEWVISKNLKRRHLSATDIAIIAEEALPLLEQEAKERWEATSKYAPRDERGRLNPARQSSDGPVDPHWNTGKAAQKAAKLFGTNRQYIEDIKAIKRKAPTLYEAMKRDGITITEAKKKLGLALERWTITLHPELDRDIINSFPKEARSEAVKEALRFYISHQGHTERPSAPSHPTRESGGREDVSDESVESRPEDRGKITTLEEAEEEMEKIIQGVFK